MIEIQNLSFHYDEQIEDRPLLENLIFQIKDNETVAILGRNGSGKSTLARLLNGLLLPTSGSIFVDGLNTRNQLSLPTIRKTIQMVFQNPEHQIVGFTVEEDIAFGLSNIGFPSDHMSEKIVSVLQLAGLSHKQFDLVTTLSGGEKQKLAIASALAISPRYLILDEATSMLDPSLRQRFMDELFQLKQEYSMSIIHVTHHTEEILPFDKVIVLGQGRIQFEGHPSDLLYQTELLEDCGIEVPYLARLRNGLHKRGLQVPVIPTRKGMVDWLCESR